MIGIAASAFFCIPISAAQDPTIEPDFGDNSSSWTHDDECDDPRFIGKGMAIGLVTNNIGRDASDCRKAFRRETIRLNPLFATPTRQNPINFGDNTSDFAFDGVCDDVRFTGQYSEDVVYLVEDIGHDADDCRKAYRAGIARWQDNSASPILGKTEESLDG